MKHNISLAAAFAFTAVLISFPASAAPGGFSGTVAETMDAGGYTYVLVNAGTNKNWAAAARFPVKPGDVVVVPDSMPMENFHSDSLKRDFPVIYFADRIAVNGGGSGEGKLPPGHPAIAGKAGNLPTGHPVVSGKTAMPKMDFTGLKPAKGGKTVAEIHAASGQLASQSVTVRGKVVKYNANIMGRNWVHIQDGTGGVGSNDLLVTSSDKAKLGDTVLVEGRVAIKKDFGSNYKYDVLVEEAKVTVE